jgi:hypothetical protein
MSNTVLYALWGGLYALCAGLGFVAAPGPTLRLLMIALSLLHFVPPLLLNRKGDRRTLTLVRNLSGIWLVLCCVLLVGNFLSALASQWVGNLLHSLLTIVVSPLVAGDRWALVIFLWAYVFFDAVTKGKKN